MTAEEWTRTFAEEIGCDPPAPDRMEEILRLASVAAHASERKAAPIACYLAGTTQTPLPDLIAAAERVRVQPEPQGEGPGEPGPEGEGSGTD
jgi:hypothetical protein